MKFSKDDDATSATYTPTPKVVVELMCQYIKMEKRFIKKKDKNETNFIYEYPCKSLCNNKKGHIALIKNNRLTNSFNHLEV